MNPKKKEDSIRSLRNNFKCTNICIMGVQEGEEGEQEIENQFEKKMTENFPNQEVQRVPNEMNPNPHQDTL